MKKLLFVLLLILVGVGLHRGWIALSRSGDDGDNKISITVDPDKAREDAAKVKDKTQDLGNRATD